MRVKEEIEKSGYFWLPSNPDKKIPGKFKISDGGKIELEVLGLFDDSTDAINNINQGKINLDRIVGHVEEYGYVTFDNCFYTKTSPFGRLFNTVYKSLLRVNQAFLGVTYDNNERVIFNKFRFSVEGIDEWVDITGIKVETEFQNLISTITFEEPKEIELTLDNEMKLLIIFSYSLPISPKTMEAKISQKVYFELVTEEDKPLDDFIGIARKLTTFLSFAIDKNVNLELISASSHSIYHEVEHGEKFPVKIFVYYPSQPFTEEFPKIDKNQMLFRYTQISEHAERIINDWLNAYEQITPALNLYFSTKIGAQRFVDGKFLALAQSLETYHRRTSDEKLMDENQYKELVQTIVDQCPDKCKKWLSGRLNYGNELNLSLRIQDIISPFEELLGKKKERQKLIRKIVDTRNYLTHYDKSLESVVSTKGKDLHMLCLKMEVIFQLQLLKILGFTKDEINFIAINSYQIQHKIQYKSN